MNLLEYVKANLNGENEIIVKRLLRKPWCIDAKTIKGKISPALFKQFLKIQRDVNFRLKSNSKSSRFFYLKLKSIAVVVHAHLSDGQEGFVKDADRLWANQLWTQILEDLKGEKLLYQTLKNSDRASLFSLYSLSHACAFLLMNIYSPKEEKNSKIVLTRNPLAEKPHRLYWFSHYLANQSLFADHILIRNLLEHTKLTHQPLYKAASASSAALIHISDHFIDKHLSLHPHYLHLAHAKDQELINKTANRSRLIVFIYLISVEKHMEIKNLEDTMRFDAMLSIKIRTEDIYKAGFEKTDLQALLDECNNNIISDKYIVDIGDEQLQLGDLSLKYAMQTYCQNNLDSMKYRGDWFEIEYVKNYIKNNIEKNSYKLHPGIKSSEKKYDADIIIEDSNTNLIFFCQIKHRSTSMHPHFRDELKEYTMNNQIIHGINQLTNLRDNINTPDILMRVKQAMKNKKITSEELIQRARFLLIHNCENLDFCTNNGITMYEWNTLRNLMKGTVMPVGRDKSTTLKMENKKFDLCQPELVMETLWEQLDKIFESHPEMSPSKQWSLLKSSQVSNTIIMKPSLTQFELPIYKNIHLGFPLI